MTAQHQNSSAALWLDPQSGVGAIEREQLAQAGLQLLPVATLDDLKQGLAKARLVVIRLMGDISLLEEVKKLTHQELRWLLEGLSIQQPKAIKPAQTGCPI